MSDGVSDLGRFAEPSLHILVSLSEGPKHGYAIMTDVEAITGSPMGPGTLYGALARLERRGLIEALEPVDRRRPVPAHQPRARPPSEPSSSGSRASPGPGWSDSATRPPEMGGTARDDGSCQPDLGAGPSGAPARLQAAGLSRRQLMRRAVGAGIGLWLLEVTAGTLGFLWSAAAQATPRRSGSGRSTSCSWPTATCPSPTDSPRTSAPARAFVTIVDPARRGWTAGRDETGEGSALNVRAMSQRCPHLGCRPNPCIEDFWFQLPLPPVAVRPPRDQGGGRALRPGAARARPVRDRGGRLGRTVRRHGADHARAIARRARAAGPDPAARSAGLRLMASRSTGRASGTGLLRLYPRGGASGTGTRWRRSSRPGRRTPEPDSTSSGARSTRTCGAPSRSAASRGAVAAALIAGGAWTIAGVASVGSPAPPDWPGYLDSTLPVAAVGVVAILVASLGVARLAWSSSGPTARARRPRHRRRPPRVGGRARRRGARRALRGRHGDRPDGRGHRHDRPRPRAHRARVPTRSVRPWSWRARRCSSRRPQRGSRSGALWTGIGLWQYVQARPDDSPRPDAAIGRRRRQPPAGPPSRPGSVMAAGSSSRSRSVGAHAALQRQLADRAPGLEGLLGQRRRLVVADHRRQRRREHQPLLDELRAAFRGGQPGRPSGR